MAYTGNEAGHFGFVDNSATAQSASVNTPTTATPCTLHTLITALSVSTCVNDLCIVLLSVSTWVNGLCIVLLSVSHYSQLPNMLGNAFVLLLLGVNHTLVNKQKPPIYRYVTKVQKVYSSHETGGGGGGGGGGKYMALRINMSIHN